VAGAWPNLAQSVSSTGPIVSAGRLQAIDVLRSGRDATIEARTPVPRSSIWKLETIANERRLGRAVGANVRPLAPGPRRSRRRSGRRAAGRACPGSTARPTVSNETGLQQLRLELVGGDLRELEPK